MNGSRRRNCFLFSLFAACFFFAQLAGAAPVTFKFHATVAEVNDPGGLLSGGINAGDVVTGTFVFDTSAQNRAVITTVGAYDFTSGVGIVTKVGTFTFRTDPAQPNFHIEVINGAKNAAGQAMDGFVLHSYNNLAVNDSVKLNTISWQLDAPHGTVGLNGKLPPNAFNLSAWTSNFGLTFEGGDLSDPGTLFLVRSHVTDIVQVPNGTLP